MTKTDTADLMKCASKIHFRTHRVRYTSRRQVLDHSRPKGILSNSVYNVPRKISICSRDQAILIGAWGLCKCKLSYEKKKKKCHMAKNDEKKVFALWLTARKPEDHWSCIAHLSAEAMLKSVVIEEKKFKHSPWAGADKPLGQNFYVNRKASSPWSFVASLKRISSTSGFIHIFS